MLTAEHRRAVDELVERTALDHHIPRIALGLVHDGAIVHERSLGDLRTDRSTVFRIASMTKSFTAAAVLALRDDGVIRLDDPVGSYVPELNGLVGPTDDSPAITVRALLSMAAGLATDDAWADRHLADDDTAMDRLFRSGAGFAAAPGTTMTYSNYGYAILGRVITVASGRRYEEFITERLLRPLGLAHTVWARDELPARTDVADPFRIEDGRVVAEPEPLGRGGFGAMGGLWSNLIDLATWVGFLADAFPPRDDVDSAVDGAPLCRASRREMQQAQRSYREPSLLHDADGALVQIGLGYGFGLQVMHRMALGPVIAHSGGLPGYGSNMRWLPAHRFGVIALANCTYAPMYRLTQQVLDILAGAGVFAPHPVPVSPELDAAAHDLVGLLNDWDDSRAAAMFADNVEADDRWERRRRAAHQLIERCGGPLHVERIDASDACAGDVVVRGAQAGATIEVQLAPTVPPRIQWYEIVLS